MSIGCLQCKSIINGVFYKFLFISCLIVQMMIYLIVCIRKVKKALHLLPQRNLVPLSLIRGPFIYSSRWSYRIVRNDSLCLSLFFIFLSFLSFSLTSFSFIFFSIFVLCLSLCYGTLIG